MFNSFCVVIAPNSSAESRQRAQKESDATSKHVLNEHVVATVRSYLRRL